MKLLPPSMIRLMALASCFTAPAMALEVRGYDAAKHDRLIHFPGAPVYHQTPEINPTFSPSAALFLGVGWPAHPTDWTRQMALVSPRHFVYASHYPLGTDWKIAFLGTDGMQHTYGIQSQTPLINSLGQQTDLMLCTLMTDIPSSLGIEPFPVLNLSSETDYQGKTMVVGGKFVRAGKMPLAGFTQLKNDPGFDTTRFAYFDFNRTTGAPNDCNYEGGDSGSPTFIMIKGRPAIIGTASNQDYLPKKISRNYLNFIPHYLSELDTLMEPEGYHMKRFYPEVTQLDLRIARSGTLQQLNPGKVAIKTTDIGAAMAHNITVQLTFSNAPDRVSGSGWICKAVSPRVWNCHRGGIASGGQSSIHARWNKLPMTETMQISATHAADGAKTKTVISTLRLK